MIPAQKEKTQDIEQTPPLEVSSQLQVSAQAIQISSSHSSGVAQTGENREIAGLFALDTQPQHFTSYDVFREQTEVTYQQISAVTEKLFGTAEVSTHAAAPAAAPAPAQAQISTGGGILVGNVHGYSQKNGYSSANLFQVQAALSNHGYSPAASQTDSITHTQAHEQPTMTDAIDESLAGAPAVVEGFEWKMAVEGSSAETITLEGWQRLQAPDHWSVVY